jgi:L-serine dehydratase
MKPYASFAELLEHCEASQRPISELAIDYEALITGKTRDEILVRMRKILDQMRDTIRSGCESEEKSMSGLSGGDAKRLLEFESRAPLPTMVTRLMAYGLATLEENSRMKKIVACPTAGGSGSVPAVLIALEDCAGVSPDDTLRGLITAGGVGELVSRRMFLSGSAAGCQAEVGVACGMAAAGMVEALGGTPKQVITAAALSMQNLMGLVCDPVAGLVEVPCVVRNGLSSVQAASAATMALAGVVSFVPLDEVVDAMVEVGRLMSPRLKESAEGGLAQTQTARAFTERLFGIVPTPAP